MNHTPLLTGRVAVQNPANPLKDYAHLKVSEQGAKPEGKRIALKPHAETGRLQEGEALGLVQTGEDGSWLTYEVAGNKLVHLPISAGTEALISKHYDFND